MGILKPYVIENGLDITSATMNLNGSAVSVNPDNSLSVNGVTLSTPDAINRAGTVWKQADFGATGSWNDMSKAGNMLFSLSNEIYGVSGNLQYRYSTDGVAWNQSELPNQTNSTANREKLPNVYDENKWIAYGNGKWVIMAHQNPVHHATTFVRVSTDGINWTEHTGTVPWATSYPNGAVNDRGNLWYSTIFDGTKFVALGGESYFQKPCVMNSTDGINWVQVSPNGWDTSNFYTVPDSDSLYLHSSADGYNGSTNIGNFNGSGYYKWVDMATDNNVIVACGRWSWADFTVPDWDGDFVAHSYDHGVTWEYHKTPFKAVWNRIEYANGVFLMTGRQTTNMVDGLPTMSSDSLPVAVRSIDGGKTWTQVTLPGPLDYQTHGISYGDGSWVICRTGLYGPMGYVLVSTDGGQTFENVKTDPVTNNLNQTVGPWCFNVQYINNKFVAITTSVANTTNLLQVSGSTLNVDCCGITIPQLKDLFSTATDFNDLKTKVLAL